MRYTVSYQYTDSTGSEKGTPMNTIATHYYKGDSFGRLDYNPVDRTARVLVSDGTIWTTVEYFDNLDDARAFFYAI